MMFLARQVVAAPLQHMHQCPWQRFIAILLPTHRGGWLRVILVTRNSYPGLHSRIVLPLRVLGRIFEVLGRDDVLLRSSMAG